MTRSEADPVSGDAGADRGMSDPERPHGNVEMRKDVSCALCSQGWRGAGVCREKWRAAQARVKGAHPHLTSGISGERSESAACRG
jgi:hypothetical protein